MPFVPAGVQQRTRGAQSSCKLHCAQRRAPVSLNEQTADQQQALKRAIVHSNKWSSFVLRISSARTLRLLSFIFGLHNFL